MKKAAMVLFILFFACCAKQTPINSPIKKNGACITENLAQDRLRRDSSKVVLVYSRDKDGNFIGAGTGFVVAKDGLVMTAKHVVNLPEIKSIFVRVIKNGVFAEKKVIKMQSSLVYDIAILEISHTFGEAAQFRSNDLLTGESLYMIGYPLLGGKELMKAGHSYSSGEFLKYIVLNGMGDARFQISTIHGAPGFSGAPVFDKDGLVVGLTNLISTGAGITFTFNVPAQYCISALAMMKMLTKKITHLRMGY